MKSSWRISVAALAGMFVIASASAQTVEAGISAWRKQDYEGAVEIWRPLAEAGDADAQFNIGQAYRLGRGVPINLAAAQTWLGRAANKGHVDAQTTLGLLLFDGGERQTGLRWLAAAAEKGDARAMLIYGTALFNGDGVKANPVLAYAYVSRAAAQGLAPAKATLADFDRLMPLAQRKAGVRLALSKASAGGRKQSASAASKPGAATTARLKPAPAPANPAAHASGSWRIQLGAFSQRASAEALYRKVSGQGALAGRRAFYIPAGAVTRLQVGPFESRAAAAKACASLRGQACFPVGG